MVSIRRVASSPVTVGVFLLLVVPVALGWLDSRLYSPLALPGYLLYALGTRIGKLIAPNYEFWVYWAPFLGASGAISAVVGGAYEWLRELAATASDDELEGRNARQDGLR